MYSLEFKLLVEEFQAIESIEDKITFLKSNQKYIENFKLDIKVNNLIRGWSKLL